MLKCKRWTGNGKTDAGEFVLDSKCVGDLPATGFQISYNPAWAQPEQFYASFYDEHDAVVVHWIFPPGVKQRECERQAVALMDLINAAGEVCTTET